MDLILPGEYVECGSPGHPTQAHKHYFYIEGKTDMDPELVFVDFVVRHLVDHPSDVHIEKTIDEQGVLLELTVAKEDLGRVIGKRGATAQSLRTLLRALGSRNNARYNLKIMEPKEE